jgi:predicted regulator of Ras-like GTPase activity (Roadblock/LC7/MglB family)
MSRADLLAQAIDDFLAVSPEVEAAAIVSGDGLPMASALPQNVEEDRLAAMSAALLILGERAARGLGKGELGQVLVEGSNGYVVLMSAGSHAVLVAVTSTDAKAGLLLFEMRRFAARVASQLGEERRPGAAQPSQEAAGARPQGEPVASAERGSASGWH